MSGAIHPLPQYALMAWCSVKAQGQLYLYLFTLILLICNSFPMLRIPEAAFQQLLLFSVVLPSNLLVTGLNHSITLET
jgi:hypothetical protein